MLFMKMQKPFRGTEGKFMEKEKMREEKALIQGTSSQNLLQFGFQHLVDLTISMKLIGLWRVFRV